MWKKEKWQVRSKSNAFVYIKSFAIPILDLVTPVIYNLSLCVVYYNLDEDDDTAGHCGDQGAHSHEPEVSRRAEHAEGSQEAGHYQHPDTLTEILSTISTINPMHAMARSNDVSQYKWRDW